MSVRKFRSVGEMEGPPHGQPLDPENLRLAVGLMDLALGLHPQRRPPGVYKYSSLEEAILHREGWEKER